MEIVFYNSRTRSIKKQLLYINTIIEFLVFLLQKKLNLLQN